MAAGRRAHLSRSASFGDARADARGGAPLLRSRALREGVAGSRQRPMIGNARVVIAVLAACFVAPAAWAQSASVTKQTLDNGLRVLVREDPAADVVAVSLVARGGSRFETPETAGITNFLQRSMIRGTKRFTGVQLAEAAERLGGTVDASGDVDFAEIRGTALARNWEPLLGLVADVALTPTLAPAEIDRERRLILGQIQTRGDNPFPLTFDSLLADLYGPHPYGLSNIGRRASIERLTRDDLLAHYQHLYQPNTLVLAISGRVER